MKITSNIKNKCISDDRCTYPMSGYMMTKIQKVIHNCTRGRIQNCIITINEDFQRYF